jgi:hypothetical protein
MWRAREGGPVGIIEGKAVEIETDTVSLGARLSELLAEESPESLLLRLQTFKRSVEDALARSSSTFQILRQLETAGLKDCARCTAELEERLAHNAHFQVLGKLAEAEALLAGFAKTAR